jgi:hypothetical protein
MHPLKIEAVIYMGADFNQSGKHLNELSLLSLGAVGPSCHDQKQRDAQGRR